MAICFFDDDESLIPIDVDDEAMDELYAVAASLLEEEDLFLQRTATTLTLQGDLEVDEDFEAMNEQFEDEAEEDDDTEFVEVLAEFEHKDQDYSVVRIANPFLLIAKQKEGTATDEYTLLGEPYFRGRGHYPGGATGPPTHRPTDPPTHQPTDPLTH